MDDCRDPTTTFRYRFWEILCANVSALFMLLIFCVVLFSFSLVIYPFSEEGTASYVLLRIDIGLLVAFIVVLTGLIYRCYQYRV